MNTILFFCLFLIGCFGILVVGMRFFPKDSIFTIAISTVIGANIYNSLDYPVQILGLQFGLDSVIYTIFLFCVLVMFIDYGKKNMLVVLYTSIFCILFTEFLFFFGKFSQSGYSAELMSSVVSYAFSAFATLLAVLAMCWVFNFLRKKNLNTYINILIALFIGALVNSSIYFGLSTLVMGRIDGLGIMLLGSYIGKFVASGLCLVAYALHLVFRNKRKKKALQHTKTD